MGYKNSFSITELAFGVQKLCFVFKYTLVIYKGCIWTYKLAPRFTIESDKIFYPDNPHVDNKIDQLIRLLYQCDDRELKIATATIKALIDNK